MNTHLIEHSPLDRPLVGTSVRTLPIRRIGGLEVPAAGAWPLLASSSVRICSSRHDDRQSAIRSGWFDVSDDPTDCWMRIETDDLLLDMTGATITSDQFELSAWRLRGNAQIGAAHGAAELDLRYHGVFRRGHRMWAWFTGIGELDIAGTSRGGRFSRRPSTTRIDLDLVLGSTR